MSAKEEGMAQALENANKDWKDEAHKAIRFLIENKQFFTSDDVMNRLDRIGVKTHNNSALGGIFNGYARRGFICQATFTISRRPSRHKAPIRVWKSLVYKKGEK